ncbi:putative secreted protein [Palleronia aestuarii]|uniref:Putative secreted protein n=1 Tax=Palleronia aestuarii TaxID=568105 RepID=A0A2W7NIB9_9RHOB|nr:VPLPA-CTERM sorting domain-containing protein [Palleronia aestuarii]PZX19620.1 putative secreted protein [Palleronia aestuarii]
MKAMFRTLAAAAALCLAGGIASAATSTFDFTGADKGYASSYIFSDNGLDLTVTAYADLFGTFPAKNPKVGQWKHGLGVKSTRIDNSHMVDGFGYREFLVFSFSKDIERLNTISFSFADCDDTFELWTSNGSTWTKQGSAHVPYDSDPSTYTFKQDWTGTLFAIGATKLHDDYKIAGLSADWDSPAPVPLPAGGILLVSGLLGLGIARARRKSA